ncbi:MAG TPA: hypothetical protein VK843_04180 [Planctomycetota bacterium]|nr:hypothetical protein [Planctomycetota bacterium]
MILRVLVALAALQAPFLATPVLPLARSAAKFQTAPPQWPADTSKEAQDSWTALLAALRPKGSVAAAPIHAFDLSIKSRVLSIENGSRQQHDVMMRFQYLEPRFVRRTFLESHVESMRGPDGDWLWDPAKNDLVQLSGQEFAQDRRELSQTVSIARNYLALAEPERLRIVKLERLRAPPKGLPALDPKDITTPKDSALTLAASLEWISVLSPDFQVVETVKSEQPPVFRAQLGLDPKSHLPKLAMIFQEEAGALVLESGVLVDFTNVAYKNIDEHLVPSFFRVHDPLLPSSPFVFQREARVSVAVLAGSTLRPVLTPDDFKPPKPKK